MKSNNTLVVVKIAKGETTKTLVTNRTDIAAKLPEMFFGANVGDVFIVKIDVPENG